MSGNVSRRVGLTSAVTSATRNVTGSRGAVLLMVAGGMVFLLAMSGLAIDSGRAYIVRSRLSRAVDAAALTGARSLRLGRPVARQQALAVAEANGVKDGVEGVRLKLQFGATDDGEPTVTTTARQPMRTVLMHLVGQPEVLVTASATAVVKPVDLVLVIDESGSLGVVGVWDDLQEAAKDFVDFFDGGLDKLGLVSFATRAENRYPLQHHFAADIRFIVDRMRSAGWTNTGEGLRLAHGLITGPEVRERSAKVVVFFTDGRPTALRGPVGGLDRIMSMDDSDPTGNTLGGYYNKPDQIPMDRYTAADGCAWTENCSEWTEGGEPPHGPVARLIAKQNGMKWADRIRGDGVYVYTIGLGSPSAPELQQPDLDYLVRLANEHGIVNPDQPQGRSYFAPSARELQAVFQRVASDLVVRLSH